FTVNNYNAAHLAELVTDFNYKIGSSNTAQTAASGTATFPAGAATITIHIHPLYHAQSTGDESVYLSLVASGASTSADSRCKRPQAAARRPLITGDGSSVTGTSSIAAQTTVVGQPGIKEVQRITVSPVWNTRGYYSASYYYRLVVPGANPTAPIYSSTTGD